jgi:hypothetical protein
MEIRRKVLALAAGLAASAMIAAAPAGEIYNVYVSVSANNVGYAAETDRVIARLKACGIRGQGDFTDAYAGFTPGLAVVLTGPHGTPAAASAELAKAGKCGLKGYSKRAVRVAGE